MKWKGPAGAQALPRPKIQKRGEWQAALRDTLARYEGTEIQRGTALRAIAKKVVELALEGDQFAIKEIGDRLDGKAAQAVNVTGDIEHKHIAEMTDAELLALIRAGSERAADEEEGENEPAPLHRVYDA